MILELCLFSGKYLSEMADEEIAECPYMPDSCCCDSCSFYMQQAPVKDVPNKEVSGDE